MKQNITKKQWYKLDPNKQTVIIVSMFNEGEFGFVSFKKNVETKAELKNIWELITIGKIIEFLGEDLVSIDTDFEYDRDGYYRIWLAQSGYKWVISDFKELCDALWEAVKFKLNNQNIRSKQFVDKNKNVNFIDANKKIKVYTDGATVGRNGKLGTVAEVGLGVYIPELNFGDSKRERGISNNEAEMKALIWAMQLVLDKGIDRADFFLDSEIAVNRAKGRRPSGKNKNIRLNLLQDDIFDLTGKFQEISFNWIPREQNEQADYYSKLNI